MGTFAILKEEYQTDTMLISTKYMFPTVVFI